MLLAVAFAVVVRLAPSPDAPGHGWTAFLAPLSLVGYAGVVMNCALALFNLIPVPPLDGSWVLMRFLPLRHIIALQQFRLLGIALVAILLSSRSISHLLLEGPLRMAVHTCLALVGAPDDGVIP
jgi:Zn-dependent protease